MKFLSDILARAGLVVEGTVTLNSVANATTDTDRFLVLDSGVVRFRTGAQILSDTGGALDSEVVHIAGTETVTGSKTFSAGISLGTVVGATGVIRNLSTDGSLVMGGSAFSNASLPARTIIISTVGTYSALTGAANLFVGRNAGASVTSGNNNVFIGKGAGSGITTGVANVIMSSSDASNLPSALSNSIHLVAGGGYRLNDASSIPTVAHVFIGGGFGSSTALRDFYFGQLPFTPDAGLVQTHITFYAPSGSGTDIPGSNFTIAGGRGTGAGTPGSVIISTSAQGASGSAVQTLVERARFNASGLTLAVITAATTDTDAFLVSDGGVVKFRTGAQLLSDIGAQAAGSFVPTTRTLTINGTTFDLSADRSWSITAGVSSVNAGSGISVSSSTGAVTVSNTGILSAVAGSGISVSTSGGTLSISNTGLLSALAGSGISVSTAGGTLSISNTGILSGVAGSGISVSTSGGTLSISNTGLLSATAGSGISVSTSGGTVSISNTGILSILAGSGISVSTSGGTVTVSNTITNNNQLTNGAGYITPNSTVSGWIAFQASTQGTPIIRAVQQDTTSGFYLFQGVTGSTEVFRIDRSGTGYFAGNLGVGTTSPTSILEIRSGANARLTINRIGAWGVSPADIKFNTNDPGTDFWTFGMQPDSTNNMRLRYNTSEYLTILTNGNVGIGTINPTQRLDVSGYIRATSGFVGNGGLQLWGDNTSTSPGLFVATGGNVGIGTTSPNRILTVYNSNAATLYQTPTSGTGANDGFYVGQVGDVSYVWNYNSFPLAFGTAATERMRITSGGQLRLSTYTSSSAWTGTAVATLAVDSSGNVITVAGGGGSSQWTTSGSNIFYNTGNVGIGTNSPSAKLHVFDSATAATILVRGIDANLASSYMLQHGGGGARTQFDGTWYMSYGSAETDFGLTPNLGGGLVFWFNSGATTVNPMTLKRSGNVLFSNNVGIGTVSPGARLDVSGTIRTDTGLTITKSIVAGETTPLHLAYSSSDGSGPAVRFGAGGNGFWDIQPSNNNQSLFFEWNDSVNLLTFRNNGNVGISNTNPAARLHVVTASSGATAATNAIAIFENNTNGVVQINGPDSSSMGLFFGRSGAAYYSGIERTGTDLLLKNANTVAVTIASSLAVTFASSITCTSLTETSTIKIKENIAPVTAALEKVDQLKPVSYNKKGSTTKEIGLIAEDVFDVFPEFVLCDDNGEPVGVHYSRLTAVLIESVKELKNKITELEKRN